jgi:TRAP-type C4-dicarboxylate transport system substrate-binding protein
MRARIASAAAMAVAVLGASARAQQGPIVLRISTLAPIGSDWAKALAQLAADVDAQTQHRVRIQLYPVGPNVDEKDVVQDLSKGALDGAELTSVGLSLVDPSIRVLELPALFDSIEETDDATARAWPYLQRKYTALRLVLAGREETGWLAYYSQGSIDSAAAFAKATTSVDPDDPLVRELDAELGISGVALSAAQLDGAFAKQAIDTCVAVPAAMQALPSSGLAKYRSSLAPGYRAGAIVITSAALGALPTADQKVVLHLVEGAAAAQVAAQRRANLDAHSALVQRGTAASAASAQLASTFDAAAHKTWRALTGIYFSKAELAMVLQYRAAYRAKHRAAAGTPPP